MGNSLGDEGDSWRMPWVTGFVVHHDFPDSIPWQQALVPGLHSEWKLGRRVIKPSRIIWGHIVGTCVGKNKVGVRKWYSLINQVTRKFSKITSKLLVFDDKKNWVTKGQVELWGLCHRDFICVSLVLLGNQSFVLWYSSWWHCYLLAVPKKVANSLLILRKETGRTAWLTIIIFLFSSYKKIGLCV